jgi:hypothetical protein
LGDWFDEVMSPVIPADPPPGHSARFAEIAEISAYFGGSPRQAAPGEAAATQGENDTDALIANARRRGC